MKEWKEKLTMFSPCLNVVVADELSNLQIAIILHVHIGFES